MSGFENYAAELAALDKEILHYAALCGVDVADRAAVRACLARPHAGWAAEKGEGDAGGAARARESLRGLLALRLKIEGEMFALGLSPPPLAGCGP